MGLFGGSSKSTSTAEDMRTVADGQSRAIVGNRNTRVLEAFSKSAFGNNSNYRESGSVDFSRGGKLVESGGVDMSGRNNKFLASGAVDVSGRNAKLLLPGSVDINAAKGSTVNYVTQSDAGALDKSLNWASDMLTQVLNAGKAQVAELATQSSNNYNQSIAKALELSASQGASISEQLGAVAQQNTLQNASMSDALREALGIQIAQTEGMSDALREALGIQIAQTEGIGATVSAALQQSAASTAGIGAQVSSAIHGALTSAAEAIGAAQPGAAAAAPKAPWYKNPLLLLALAGGGYLLMRGKKA